jgi:hypothetical protein
MNIGTNGPFPFQGRMSAVFPVTAEPGGAKKIAGRPGVFKSPLRRR